MSKSVVFRSFGALPWLVILEGLIVGASLTVGTFIAKPFVRRLDPQHFRWMMDGIMLVRNRIAVDGASRSMIPKKPAPHLMRGRNRFSEKIMLQNMTGLHTCTS